MSENHDAGLAFTVAPRDYKSGEPILSLGATPTTAGDCRRLQVDESRFILPPQLRHSCNPNGRIDWATVNDAGGLVLEAVGLVAEGELLTYDYGTSELDYSIGAFTCDCGSLACVGYFRGFMYLDRHRKDMLYPWVSPYIRNVYDSWRR